LTSKRKNEWDKNTIGSKESLKKLQESRFYYDGDKRILNLTPHTIHIIGVDGEDIYIPKSGAELRLSTRQMGPLDLGFSHFLTYYPDCYRLNIYFKRNNRKNLLGKMPISTRLDKEMPNTYFLTSRISAIQLSEYKRILVVGEPGQRGFQPHLSLYHEE